MEILAWGILNQFESSIHFIWSLTIGVQSSISIMDIPFTQLGEY